MKKETENWLKIANNDLKMAKALFKEGLYLGVIEHGHAALEKLIKGIIVDQSNENPPKIHSLLMNIEKKLEHYIKSITGVMNVDMIILFGSFAKGNPHEYSDIDLAVISKEIDPDLPRWENIRIIKEKANIYLDPDLQIIPFAKEAFENDQDSPIGSFIREIKKTGKIIYSNGK